MEPFIWRDGERTILFGEGHLGRARELLDENGYESYDLVTTKRAVAEAPESLQRYAGRTHWVAPVGVPAAAAVITSAIKSDRIVALGGGRVIDVAKAVAAVNGSLVAAVPTTLAGSPITGIHRLPAGRESEAKKLVRPSLVIADPEPMTSLPEKELRATAMNALAHGAESLYTPYANPVSELCALRGAELIAGSLDAPRATRPREDLALGAMLGAHAISSTGLALHHAVCQTIVRILGLPHAEVNATMLPHTMEAMRSRAPEQISKLAAALGTTPEKIGPRISELGGGPRRLAELGADSGKLDQVLDAIAERGDVAAMTPDPPDREQLRAILQAAW